MKPTPPDSPAPFKRPPLSIPVGETDFFAKRKSLVGKGKKRVRFPHVAANGAVLKLRRQPLPPT